MKLLLLTPIEKEFSFIKSYLNNGRYVHKEGVDYFKGSFEGYEIVILQSGSKTDVTALSTQISLQHWQPDLIFLLGIAGGIKDTKIGDLVIGTKAYGYESGKYIDSDFLSRPDVIPYDPLLISTLQRFSQNIPKSAQTGKIYFGPIASGNKLIASKQSIGFQTIKKYYNDTIAVEMEAIGFAKAITRPPQYRGINIRAISDLIDDKQKTDQLGGQEEALHNLCSFFFGFLKYTDLTHLKNQNMNPKELASHIVSILFPLLKLDSIQQIGKEFKSASDQSIKELWETVKPWFIEEIENGEDALEAKGAIKSGLRKELEKNEDLKKEVEKYIEHLDSTPKNKHSMSVTNSHGVIQGNISVGRDLNFNKE